MTDLDILHAAILADPKDDLARLAYADELESLDTEASRVRAEFIRVQMEYVTLQSDECACGFVPYPADNPSPITLMVECEVCRLQRLETKAWEGMCDSAQVHPTGWVPESPFRGSLLPREDVATARNALDLWGGAGVIIWRRGFADEIRCMTKKWKSQGKKMVRTHPISRVRFVDKNPMEVRNHGVWRDGIYHLREWTRWAWYPCGSGAPPESSLPVWIYNMVRSSYPDVHPKNPLRAEGFLFDDHASALSKLSDSALAWAYAKPKTRAKPSPTSLTPSP